MCQQQQYLCSQLDKQQSTTTVNHHWWSYPASIAMTSDSSGTKSMISKQTSQSTSLPFYEAIPNKILEVAISSLAMATISSKKKVHGQQTPKSTPSPFYYDIPIAILSNSSAILNNIWRSWSSNSARQKLFIISMLILPSSME